MDVRISSIIDPSFYNVHSYLPSIMKYNKKRRTIWNL